MINSMTKWLSLAISISEEYGCVFQCGVFEFWHCRFVIVKIRNKIKNSHPFEPIVCRRRGSRIVCSPETARRRRAIASHADNEIHQRPESNLGVGNTCANPRQNDVLHLLCDD